MTIPNVLKWQGRPIPSDPEGRAMFRGSIEVKDLDGWCLASVIWFYEDGPYYAHAVDPSEPDIIRRIGPHMTLDEAKASAERGVRGEIKDLTQRAGYPRHE